MKKNKIAILLPFKDNFTNSKAGSASIWVKDFNKKSIYKNQIAIFGNTDDSYDLIDNKNYINLSLRKFIVGSKNILYVKEFIKYHLKHKFDLIEIHNRPSYVHQIIKSKVNANLVLIFHNNPLTLGGSRSLKERKVLLNRCDNLIFVSYWVKEKFFEGFESKHHQKCKVIYPSIDVIKKFPKKSYIISFVGKLNRSKGFHIFGDAIIKILNKYNNWKSVVVGDEPREKYNFRHKNLEYKGWISHKKTLELYKKTSISVIPSSWEEPFGRTSMEAASRGCATIVSKKGGLIETVSSTIFLTKLSKKELFDKIEFLITNKKIMREIQIKSFKNVFHKLDLNTKKIDIYRSEILNNYNFSIKRERKAKILHISNFGNRLSNRLYFISIAKKISNGFIKLGHDVINLSDRDIIKFNRYISGKSGIDYLNKLFLESVQNYNPDLVLLGHSDNIDPIILEKIKNSNKNIKIAQWFEDNLAKSGPDPQSNQKRLLQYEPFIDFNFITTHPSVLNFLKNKKNYFYMPIPVDRNIEKLSIYNNEESIYDLFFTMSHGVNRGILKPYKKDERDPFINELVKKNPNIVFDIYGYKKRQPIWSEDFYHTINLAKMGLNLSRTNSVKYYTSNRISSLIGNGLMTFIDRKTQLDDFFSDDEVIFYKNINDLSEKLNYFKKNDSLRRKIAKKGQIKYFEYFDNRIICNYILNKVFDLKIMNKFDWMKN